MHIVHCAPAFSPLTQTFIYGFVTGLQARGVQTSVLTWRRTNEDARPFDAVHMLPRPSRAERAWIRLAALVGHRRLSGLLTRRTRFERAVHAALKDLQPGCIHAHFGTTGVWLHRACADAQVPLVVTFRGKDASAKLRKTYWRRIYGKLGRHCAAVTTVSQDLADRLQPLLPADTPCQVVHAGKDTAAIPFRAPPPPGGRLLSVGRLSPKKGHDIAIRALAAIRGAGVDARLAIIGGGRQAEQLRRLSEQLGVAPYVELQGALPHDQVLEAYQHADLLIAANRTAENGDTEGVPNVLKEAQLSGLPVVTTRHGGIPWVVPPEHAAELVPEDDVDGIARQALALLRLDQTGLEQRARRARAHVCEHFGAEAEIEAYTKLYRRHCDL